MTNEAGTSTTSDRPSEGSDGPLLDIDGALSQLDQLANLDYMKDEAKGALKRYLERHFGFIGRRRVLDAKEAVRLRGTSNALAYQAVISCLRKDILATPARDVRYKTEAVAELCVSTPEDEADDSAQTTWSDSLRFRKLWKAAVDKPIDPLTQVLWVGAHINVPYQEIELDAPPSTWALNLLAWANSNEETFRAKYEAPAALRTISAGESPPQSRPETEYPRAETVDDVAAGFLKVGTS